VRTAARHRVMTKGSTSRPVRWFHEVMADGAVTLRRGKQGDRLVAEWPGIARLTCGRDGSAPTLVPAAGLSRRAVNQLRAGAVNALLRDLAGQLALHASAVAIDGRAVIFLGENGAGKSTAAAEMCLRHRAELLADDVALVEIGPAGVNVLPSEANHWLTRESCIAIGAAQSRTRAIGDKRRLRSSSIARGPCPLALVVALSFSPTLTRAALVPSRGGDAARLLFAAATRFDIEDVDARRREFEQVTAVYRRAPFLELVRPEACPGEVAPFVMYALKMGMP
jgi:hypothetical protein